MIDATPGGENADVYCTLAFAHAYHAQQLHNEDWFNTTQDDLAAALVVATQYIDLENYRGYPASTTQALKFPRTMLTYRNQYLDSTVVPLQVMQACAQLALDYIRSDFAKRTTASSGAVTSIKAGSFQINYGGEGATTSEVEFFSAVVIKLLEPFRQVDLGFVRV